MQKFTKEIEYYLERFRRGEVEDAFHGLLEMDRDIVPELVTIFRSVKDVDARKFLVEVIWEYRDASVIPFLGEVLLDEEPRIWREALNGLVTLALPAALDALRAARKREFSTEREAEEFRRWVDEAIEQVEEAIT